MDVNKKKKVKFVNEDTSEEEDVNEYKEEYEKVSNDMARKVEEVVNDPKNNNDDIMIVVHVIMAK